MNETDTLLRQARTAGADDRDRICEELAAQLIDAGQEPPWTVSSADFDVDAELICADRYWRLRFLAAPHVRTAVACGRWLRERVPAEHQVVVEQKWALGYGFITRNNVESETTVDASLAGAPDDDVRFFAALYHAGKLRANYAFEPLATVTSRPPLADDDVPPQRRALVTALRAFAAFGSAGVTARRATSLLTEAWTSTDRTRHVTDICLNGIWAAKPFDGKGELLRAHALEAIEAHPGDHMFHFRLATGQRLCGRFDDALDAIDTALERLPASGTRTSHKELQELFVNERILTVEGAERARRDAEQQRRWQEQEDRLRELRRELDASTLRTVEVVSLFTAVIAFVVGSVSATVTGTLDVGQRLLLIGGFGAGLALFAMIIVGFTARARRRGGPH